MTAAAYTIPTDQPEADGVEAEFGAELDGERTGEEDRQYGDGGDGDRAGRRSHRAGVARRRGRRGGQRHVKQC